MVVSAAYIVVPELPRPCIEKVGAAIFINDKLLLCRKKDIVGAITTELIIPGGRKQGGETDVQTLQRKMDEELNVLIDFNQPGNFPSFLGVYKAPAAGLPGTDVRIWLYEVSVDQSYSCGRDIAEFVWVGRCDIWRTDLTPIVRLHIMPDLIQRSLL